MLNGALFLMSGGGQSSDWVKNMRADPRVSVRLGQRVFAAAADLDPRDVDQGLIRRTMAAKYQGWELGEPLSGWAQTALVVRLVQLNRG